jgi:hypothetical protein
MCMKKCSNGAYCGPAVAAPNGTLYRCDPYGYATLNASCGGANQNLPCVPGHYCVGTVSMTNCSKGYYCPMGVNDSIPCEFGLLCDEENLSLPSVNIWSAVVFLAILSFLLAVMLRSSFDHLCSKNFAAQ